MAKLEKEVFLRVKRANLKFKLIEDGDRVAAGLSGGKDSLVLLQTLTMLLRYTPLRFEIIPITVDLGQGADYSRLRNHCAQLGYPLVVEETNISKIVFDERQEKNPCALCANLRRGALNRVAGEHGCNKVALAHHLDDAVVTLLMSMAFEGQFRSFKPATYLSRTSLTVIRPLVYVPESFIIRLCQKLGLPVVSNPCPATGLTKRAVIHNWVNTLEKENPGTKQRFLVAMEKSYW